jgi:hypothetical protein
MEEAFANMFSIFLYSLMRNYDKSSKFDIPSNLSPALCDAAIKTNFARLQALSEATSSASHCRRGLKDGRDGACSHYKRLEVTIMSEQAQFQNKSGIFQL